MQSAQLPLGVPVSPIVDDGDGPVHPPAEPYTIQTNSSGTTRGRGSAATVQKVQPSLTVDDNTHSTSTAEQSGSTEVTRVGEQRNPETVSHIS